MKKYCPRVRSRHPSHNVLRGVLPLMDIRCLIRFGSTTTAQEVFGDKEPVVEINSIEGIKTSSNKLLMKQKFTEAGVSTAQWFVHCDNGGDGKNNMNDMSKSLDYNEGDYVMFKELPYPIVAKHIFGSRGTGNYLLHDEGQLTKWLQGKDVTKYIFEKYYSYNKEYRLHVTKDGCFYTCRKMLKGDIPSEKRWFRNDSNSVWIKEENDLFDKPASWNDIVADCVKALAAVGLDFAAFDVRVQSKPNKEGKTKWIIIESNSAPSFGDVTAEKYFEMLPKLIEDKWKSQQ